MKKKSSKPAQLFAAGNLTITPQRLKQIDFAAPLLTGIDEIIVTGPKSPQVKAVDDLAGKEIYVCAMNLTG